MRHRDGGYAVDRKNLAIAARQETVRTAKPLLTDDLRALLEGLSQGSAAEARDAALLALGWAAALRRSEPVGLDWQNLS
jgi:integrase